MLPIKRFSFALALLAITAGCTGASPGSDSTQTGKCIVHLPETTSYGLAQAKRRTEGLTYQVETDLFSIASRDDVLTCGSYYAPEGYCAVHKTGEFWVGAGLVPLRYVIEGPTPFYISYDAAKLSAKCPVTEGATDREKQILSKLGQHVPYVPPSQSQRSELSVPKILSEYVDANEDGIRDDIETKIDLMTDDATAKKYLEGYAKQTHRLHENTDPAKVAEISEKTDLFINCILDAQYEGKYVSENPLIELSEAITNTQERRMKKRAADRLESEVRPSTELPSSAELKKLCAQAI